MSEETKNKILTELPKRQFGNKQVIDWNALVGTNVKVIYQNKNYLLYISKYNKSNSKLTCVYDEKETDMSVGHFKNCKFGNLLKVFNKEYKYDIGQIIKNKTGKIKILEQMRISCNSKTDRNRTDKGYKYECLECGNIDTLLESHLNIERGCNVCCKPPQKIVQGINDITTTHPQLAKYFFNIEDTYKYTYSSSEKVLMICPDCGFKKDIAIYSLYNDGFSCICSDSISYPEKFMLSLLKQLNITFEYQKVFDWSKKSTDNGMKKYDFYFNLDNKSYILEVNGNQHYENSFVNIGKGLEEEQENDGLKERLAKSNYIENYIVIEARKSELKFIKNNIMGSDLANIFDLSEIDWLKCEEYACSNLVKEASNLWSSGIRSTTDISKMIKVARTTTCKYLKQGATLGWCDYNAEIVQKKNREYLKTTILPEKLGKKVLCVETNVVYNSISEASRKTNIKGISDCCRGRIKSSGGFSWKYYE